MKVRKNRKIFSYVEKLPNFAKHGKDAINDAAAPMFWNQNSHPQSRQITVVPRNYIIRITNRSSVHYAALQEKPQLSQRKMRKTFSSMSLPSVLPATAQQCIVKTFLFDSHFYLHVWFELVRNTKPRRSRRTGRAYIDRELISQR